MVVYSGQMKQTIVVIIGWLGINWLSEVNANLVIKKEEKKKC